MLAENIKRIMTKKGMRNKELAEKSGVPIGTLNKILYGDTKDPSISTMRLLANALECTLDDFSEPNEQGYYLNDETAAIAQEIRDNPELRILFDASRDASPEELKLVAEMVKAARKKEGNDF